MSETPATPAAAHSSGGFGRTAFGAPGTPGQGTEGDFGTVGEGRYRLTRRLGRGGMAEVFAAEDLRLGRTVAVKLLRPELAQDDVARLRFTREAHSVAALNHHAVVAVYDTGEEELPGGESMPYIVMELVEGRTVRELLVDEEAPPVDQALIIIAGVLEALAYSHRHGIVHRDIKPANVIITTTGAVKVMDFGIARALTGAASTMTQTGMVMGTPQYLSPEQALGKAVDHRSDLYATGCMLYELLTLRPPFTGDTPLSVVYQHVQDTPRPPSQANHRVPPQLDALVLRSLAKDPDDRFQSADEFRAHAQQALREMHGGGGSGYAAGAAAAAAAAAGLAAAGSGTASGATPPAGSYAPTEQFGTTGRFGSATPPMGAPMASAPTAVGPGYRPYETSGGYGPGGAGPAGPDDDEPHRRGPLLWLALAAAAAVAVVAAIITSGGGTQGGGTDTPSGSPSPTATSSQGTRNAPAPAPTANTPTGGGQTYNGTTGGSSTTRVPTTNPPTSAAPTSAAPTSAAPTSAPPTSAPPTSAPPSASVPQPSTSAGGGAAGGTDGSAGGGAGGGTQNPPPSQGGNTLSGVTGGGSVPN
nr:protein kinase [Streptacidiphilus sp. ASG 303]